MEYTFNLVYGVPLDKFISQQKEMEKFFYKRRVMNDLGEPTDKIVEEWYWSWPFIVDGKKFHCDKALEKHFNQFGLEIQHCYSESISLNSIIGIQIREIEEAYINMDHLEDLEIFKLRIIELKEKLLKAGINIEPELYAMVRLEVG